MERRDEDNLGVVGWIEKKIEIRNIRSLIVSERGCIAVIGGARVVGGTTTKGDRNKRDNEACDERMEDGQVHGGVGYWS
jgi:hypothetical protein